MIERTEALNSVRKARDLLGERMPRSPGHGVYVHASEQLERMLKDLSFPYLPPATKREWVDIGLMAAKELDAVDSELANALMDADYDFKHAS
jgi:hypothetical protein